MNFPKIIKRTVKTDWKDILLDYDGFDKMQKGIAIASKDAVVYPPKDLIFNAFNFFDFKETKVCIVGLDPYIRKGQAMGLSFSVPEGVKLPPSLKNIYKELKSDLGVERTSGDLTDWARQGVLLLNTALTVKEGKSSSHAKYWQLYTHGIIEKISDDLEGVVFVLWGNKAKAKKSLIDTDRHHIIEGAHPSPLSANKGGFFGGKYFSRCNEYLEADGINW